MSMRMGSARSWLLRLAGAGLLVAAWRIAAWLVVLGQGLAGRQPPKVYLLCLLAFLCASAGGALLANGARLFGTVQRSENWASHLDESGAEPRRRD